MIQRGKKLDDLKGTDKTKKGSEYDIDLDVISEALEKSDRDMWLGLLAVAVVSIIATAFFLILGATDSKKVEDIVIIAPQPDEETQKAIDDRVKATQELERKKTDKLIATEEAERKKIEATGEAEANQIVEDSLTEKVLQQQLIEKWSGEQPISIGAEGGVIVDLPQSTSKGSE